MDFLNKNPISVTFFSSFSWSAVLSQSADTSLRMLEISLFEIPQILAVSTALSCDKNTFSSVFSRSITSPTQLSLFKISSVSECGMFRSFSPRGLPSFSH